jgi:predicted acylesterase/phospholipase RssA
MRTLANIAIACIAITVSAVALPACAQRRPVQPESELLAERAEIKKRFNEGNRQWMEFLVKSVHERRATEPQASVDVLVVSGGGDWGAFGTGALIGWSGVPAGPNALPKFQVVSGVSTGALIAPFAYLGTAKDLKAIDDLYRNPKSDWVKSRGPLFFLPDNASFAEVPGLEREVDKFIDMDFAKRIAKEFETGRIVVIQTTNMDDGSAQPFNWSFAAKQATEDGNIRRLQNILLASSGIPGAFPPREIDGSLYVDGAVTSNIIYGGAFKRNETFGATWKRMYAGESIPKIRYWVILNNYAAAQPVTVQPTWPSVISRALEVAVRASTTIALRHLYSMAEVNQLRGDGDIEVRWMAIPDSWKAPTEGIFQQETMRSLSDLGMKIGADPASWQTEAP